MINKVILIGNVGADPEVQYIKEDQPVAHLRIATSEGGYKRQNGTEVPERTDWHRLTVWGRTAKFCENFVKKGDQVYVEGRLHYSQYQDKNNETRYSALTRKFPERAKVLFDRNEQAAKAYWDKIKNR